MYNCLYTYVDELRGLEITCDVNANVEHYVHATYFHPSEGGYLEDVCFQAIECFITLNGKKVEIPLNKELEAELSLLVNDAYENSDVMKEKLYDKMVG